MPRPTRAPGGGRKPRDPAAGPADHRLGIALTTPELATLDARRGPLSRAEYARRRILPRVCASCRLDRGGTCDPTERPGPANRWAATHCGDDGLPKPAAPDCPEWESR